MNASLTVVYWRDIPAQVIARAGRRTARRALSGRFQEAIDRAAMRAGLSDSDAYLGEWRRGEAPPADGAGGHGPDRDAGRGDLEAQADALARRLEAELTAEVLAALVAAGGRAPESSSESPVSDRGASDSGDSAPVSPASSGPPGQRPFGRGHPTHEGGNPA